MHWMLEVRPHGAMRVTSKPEELDTFRNGGLVCYRAIPLFKGFQVPVGPFGIELDAQADTQATFAVMIFTEYGHQHSWVSFDVPDANTTPRVQN